MNIEIKTTFKNRDISYNYLRHPAYFKDETKHQSIQETKTLILSVEVKF